MRRIPLPLSIAIFTSLSASIIGAQEHHSLIVDIPESYFELSGISYLGGIVANPSGLNMGGAIGMDLAPPAGPFLGGQFPQGIETFHTVPSILYAEIPNLFSWLPPLCEIEMHDASFQLRSPIFSIDSSGTFQTDVELHPKGGYLLVTPILSQTTQYYLDQYGPSLPTPVTGEVIAAQGITTLHMPLDISKTWDDPAQGMWATITFDVTLHAQVRSQSKQFDLTVAPLTAGQMGDFSITDAKPSRPAWLGYGFFTGDVYVPYIRSYLGIVNPQVAGSYIVTDALGNGQWNIPIPQAASGHTVHFQSAQIGGASQVISMTIQ